jgi:hypothetical protein
MGTSRYGLGAVDDLLFARAAGDTRHGGCELLGFGMLGHDALHLFDEAGVRA